jgi:dephospho-CoA kinase
MTTSGILSSVLKQMSIQELKKQKIIALTGGIASGKSFACGVFKSCGLEIIDLDDLSKEIYQLKQTNDDLLDMFGTCEKSKLKAIVFNDKQKLQQLEDYLHPKILKNMQEKIKLAKSDVMVAVPLLFEKKLYDYFDSAVVILTSPKLQIERMIKRDNIDESLALKILNNQATNEQRLEISQHLPATFIENDASLEIFEKRLRKFCE